MEKVRIETRELHFSTHGEGDIIDLTNKVQKTLNELNLTKGTVTCFVPGSTAGLTTIEYERGLKKDLPILMEKLIPKRSNYHHNATWGDGNAFSHLRHALIGPSLTVPFSEGKLILGTSQQIVFLEFDNTPRKRKVILQFIGI